MAFESPTVVRLKNVGKVPFQDRFANVPYAILPGKEVIIPWEAALTWLGDPRLRDDEDRALFERTDELHRILVRLGAHVDSDAPPMTDEQRIEAARPLVEISDVDGERIIMLSEDPTGESSLPARFTRGDQDDLRGELDRLKNEQARLLSILEAQANAQTSPGLDSVPDDTPSKVPTGPAGGYSGGDV